jgi:hypothetical protein
MNKLLKFRVLVGAGDARASDLQSVDFFTGTIADDDEK